MHSEDEIQRVIMQTIIHLSQMEEISDMSIREANTLALEIQTALKAKGHLIADKKWELPESCP